MGRYVINYAVDNRFEGVSIINLVGQETIIDGTALTDRPELTYDQLGGTVAPDGTVGTGGSITLTYKGDSYMVTIAPFTGKLTVIELTDSLLPGMAARTRDASAYFFPCDYHWNAAGNAAAECTATVP